MNNILLQTKNIYIGSIYKNLEEIEKNVLLYYCKEDNFNHHWFYSPKHRKFFVSNLMLPDLLFVDDLRQFNYKNLQDKNIVSRMRVHLLYSEFIRNLVDPKKFYIGEIRKATKLGAKNYRERERVFQYEIEGADVYKIQENFAIYYDYALLEEIAKDKYYSKDLERYISTNPTLLNEFYVRNLEALNYDIGSESQITRDDINQIYQRQLMQKLR